LENKPTFNDIENYSEIVEENDFFIQFTNTDIPTHYESNYLLLKFSPSLEEFKLIEKMHRDYQKSIQQNHLKMNWPENVGLHPELLNYFNQQNYKLGMQSLYWVTPDSIKVKTLNQDLSMQQVTNQNFKNFLKMNLEEDQLYGEPFLNQQKRMYPYQFQLENTTFILAYLKGEPVGSLILIHSEEFLEVDHVLTKAEYRGNNIAATMLDYVVNEFTNKEPFIILVADAEDTPKKMYEKMGFQTNAYQISAQKFIQ